MAKDLRLEADQQDLPLPQTMPDHSPRPLDKAPPDMPGLGSPEETAIPPKNEPPCSGSTPQSR
jgi:hypothetical protein